VDVCKKAIAFFSKMEWLSLLTGWIVKNPVLF